MEESIASRLRQYIEHLGISTSQFADGAGIPRPSLSQLLTGRNKKVSNTLISQIHLAYPELSVTWLMFGEGAMLVMTSPLEADCGGENAIEKINFTYDESDVADFSKEKGLNSVNVGRNLSVNKENELKLKISQLESKIEELAKNPRKVTQITVYYDDSTFETFFPGTGR